MPKKDVSFSKLLPGDILEVSLDQSKLHGSFIRYDATDEVLILKLKSGYDVVLSKKEIKAVSIVGRAVSSMPKTRDTTGEQQKEFDIELIATGGTIASKIDYATGGVSPSFSGSHYIELAPEMGKYGRIKVKILMNIFSENMLPSDWVKIAKEAYSAVKSGAKGIIVTMGTDTMHFASSAMSFMLNPLSVPVIFTGSQRSSDRGSSDAASNLLLSAIAASKWGGGESVICMHATIDDGYNFILRGNKARKMHTERRDAFRPINISPLCKVFPDGKIEKITEYIPKSAETTLDTKIDSSVKLLISHPGMGGEMLKYYIDKKVHGFVIAATGFGNLPLADKSLMSALKDAGKKGIPIVITSQTVYGSTNRFVYSTLRELSGFDNIIYVNDMLTETAFTKLMFVLGHTKDIHEVKRMMQTPLAGEISLRNNISDYLL